MCCFASGPLNFETSAPLFSWSTARACVRALLQARWPRPVGQKYITVSTMAYTDYAKIMGYVGHCVLFALRQVRCDLCDSM